MTGTEFRNSGVSVSVTENDCEDDWSRGVVLEDGEDIGIIVRLRYSSLYFTTNNKEKEAHSLEKAKKWLNS